MAASAASRRAIAETRPVKRWLAVCTVALLLAVSRAGAADCRPVATLSEAIAAGHEYVVKARVVRVRPPVAHTGVLPVMFSVMRKYRGAAPQILTVDFDPANDPRPLSFHPGEVYLLSALPSGTDAKERAVGTACTLRQLVDVR
jgi:hypothetical protein